MKKCPACHVQIQSTDNYCPLCGAQLEWLTDEHGKEEKPSTDEALYPKFVAFGKDKNEISSILIKIFFFASICVLGTCFIVNLFTWNGNPWFLFCWGGVGVTWVLVGLPLMTQLNINLMLILQMAAIWFYMLLIDLLSGFTRWSVNYIVPGLYIAIALAMSILFWIFNAQWRNYLVSLFIMALLGLIPVFLIFSQIATVSWLNAAAFFCSLLLICGLALFLRKKSKIELFKRMNL